MDLIKCLTAELAGAGAKFIVLGLDEREITAVSVATAVATAVDVFDKDSFMGLVGRVWDSRCEPVADEEIPKTEPHPDLVTGTPAAELPVTVLAADPGDEPGTAWHPGHGRKPRAPKPDSVTEHELTACLTFEPQSMGQIEKRINARRAACDGGPAVEPEQIRPTLQTLIQSGAVVAEGERRGKTYKLANPGGAV
jgi:hypothetical protein